jgi:hypothetical protein
MRRFLEELVAASREKAGPWLNDALDEARALQVVAADVARYARDRLRDLRQEKRSVPDAMETILNQLVLELANGLIEAKKQVAVAIADKNRLAHYVEQERANVEEWARRAHAAAGAGDGALAAEALQRRAAHEAIVASMTPRAQEQAANVEQLKATLRELNSRIEDAKRTKNVILARRQIARSREVARIELRRVDEILRLVDRLTALEEPPKPGDVEGGEGGRGLLN